MNYIRDVLDRQQTQIEQQTDLLHEAAEYLDRLASVLAHWDPELAGGADECRAMAAKLRGETS